MPDRHVFLFGNKYWCQGLLAQCSQQLLVKTASVNCFDDPALLAEAIEKAKGDKAESIILCESGLAESTSLLEALEEGKDSRSSMLLLFSCSLATLLNTLIFFDQVDTLNELGQTLMAESKASLKALTL